MGSVEKLMLCLFPISTTTWGKLEPVVAEEERVEEGCGRITHPLLLVLEVNVD
jgi:hypothetical protein